MYVNCISMCHMLCATTPSTSVSFLRCDFASEKLKQCAHQWCLCMCAVNWTFSILLQPQESNICQIIQIFCYTLFSISLCLSFQFHFWSPLKSLFYTGNKDRRVTNSKSRQHSSCNEEIGHLLTKYFHDIAKYKHKLETPIKAGDFFSAFNQHICICHQLTNNLSGLSSVITTTESVTFLSHKQGKIANENLIVYFNTQCNSSPPTVLGMVSRMHFEELLYVSESILKFQKGE